jgi:O-antigen/teichoic acid export membrane protein
VSFVRNAASILATTAVSIPLALLANVILARFLSGSERGVYALATGFALVAQVVAHLGWGDAAIYRLRRHRVAPARVFSTGLVANLLLCGLLFAVCFALERPIVDRLLGGMPRALYWVAVLTAACFLLGDFLRAIARGLDRFDLHNWFGFLQAAGLLVGLVLALVAWHGGLAGALYTYLGVQAALVAVLGLIVARLTGIELRVDGVEVREHLHFGLGLYPQALLKQLHERIDLFILAWLAIDNVQIGLYAVAVSVIIPLQLIPGAIGTALLPELAGREDESLAGFSATVARQISMQMAAAAAVMVPAGIIGIPILFGSEYQGSVLPYLIVLPGLCALATSRVLSRYFAIVGRQGTLTGIRTAVVVLNVVLNLVLIPPFGINGAALAALISYLAETAVVAALFVGVSQLRLGEAFAWRRSDLDPYLARSREVWKLARRRLS